MCHEFYYNYSVLLYFSIFADYNNLILGFWMMLFYIHKSIVADIHLYKKLQLQGADKYLFAHC